MLPVEFELSGTKFLVVIDRLEAKIILPVVREDITKLLNCKADVLSLIRKELGKEILRARFYEAVRDF